MPSSGPPARPVVLVTGCSTGIGRAAVLHLRKAGFVVVATARRADSIADLAAPGEVECLVLDVTDEAQRRAAVAEVLARHGRIDALVNNAGYGAILAMEDTSADALREVFETNVVAAHELSRLVLPAMRKQGSGRIVNVASIAGHLSVPLLGAYCASKFALRALSQSLHNEVRRFGVFVSLVEPGVIKTEFGNRSLAERERLLPEMESSVYAPLYRKWMRMRMTRRGASADVIARRITHACAAHRPRFHYLAPLDAKAGNLVKRLVPDSWTNAGFRWYFGRGG